MQTPAPKAQTAATPQEFVVRGPGGQISIDPVIAGAQGSQTIAIPGPRTAQDISVLKARREELSTQLESVDSRRSKLISQLKQTGDPIATKGLEARLALLDARQLQLESDLQQTGQQLSSAPAGLIAGTSAASTFGELDSSQTMTLSVLSILFVLFPLTVALARRIWKRSSSPGPPAALFTESAQRLERLEASVDAIAIEVERVSEGQRFVTKLLSEGQSAPVLGAGQRAPEIVRGV